MALTRRVKLQVLERYGWRCILCGYQTPPAERDGCRQLRRKNPNPMTVDHIIPVAKGGKNAQSNLQAMCYQCNQRKADVETAANENPVELPIVPGPLTFSLGDIWPKVG